MILDSFLEFCLCPNWVSSLIMKIINWWDVGISNKKGSIEYFSLTLPSHDEVMGLSWPLIGKIIFRHPDVWTYSGIRAYKAESISARILINLDLWPRRNSSTRSLTNTKDMICPCPCIPCCSWRHVTYNVGPGAMATSVIMWTIIR